MKIIKIADTFEEQIHPEENIEEMDRAEYEKEMEDRRFGKRGPTSVSEIIMYIKDSLGKPIKASWVANGAVGWFEVDDVIYEVSVAPAAYGNYFDYFKELLNRSNLEESDEDNIPM